LNSCCKFFTKLYILQVNSEEKKIYLKLAFDS
jgi:hypothetical protein